LLDNILLYQKNKKISIMIKEHFQRLVNEAINANWKLNQKIFHDGKITEEEIVAKRPIHEATMFTNRSLKFYCDTFNIAPESLYGKTVLNLGAGKRQRFEKEAEKFGASVVSLSPEYKKWLRRRLAKGLSKNKNYFKERQAVAGEAQHLPFLDNSFDMIFAVYSVPFYLHYDSEKKLGLEEIIRTCKPEGQIYITPLGQEIKNDSEYLMAFGKQANGLLAKQNCEAFTLPNGIISLIIIKKE
jgi:SAM-dependent methyltransferase